VLRRRFSIASLLVAAAAAVHITTAIWFAVLVGVAVAVLETRLRRLLFVAAAVLAGGVWAMTAGPLRASMTRMDDVWLQAVATKDSLFASQWPLWAWAANLGFLAVLWWVHMQRARRSRASGEDAALVWGATALVVLFLVTLPLVTARLALPVQLQISRIFWLVDVVALVYVVSLATRRRVAMALAVVLVTASVARSVYVMLIERPERLLFAVRLTNSPWEDAMAWLARQPVGTHVLADPGHAWKYGTSVRVSAGRDVFLEEVKDSAIALYSRDVAVRVVERTSAIGDFNTLTADRARELARRYDLDYLITEADLPLDVAYRNAQFRIYGVDLNERRSELARPYHPSTAAGTVQ
jgi:hypothetical protein